MAFFSSPRRWNASDLIRPLIWMVVVVGLYVVYVTGITTNPPGFYVDEAGLSYNAYLLTQTGAGEFGPRWPLFFQIYTSVFTQYANPIHIYLLALVFWLFGPGILVARLLAAASVFAASLSLGGLAGKVSGKRSIGVIVSFCALATPWLFEVGRLVLETFFYPMAVILFLWAVYRAHKKNEWTWINILAIAATLALLSYTYTIGRLLAGLFALGLISFATNRKRLFAVGKTWLVFALTLIPLIVFSQRNPGLSTRFYLVSYIQPGSTWNEIIPQFVSRFIEDISPVRLLFTGDTNTRHHIPDALGSFYIAAFILALIGIWIVLAQRWRDPWWRFVSFGLFASVVPGALTSDSFHTLRMIAYPIFLLLLMVPAIEWLLAESQIVEETTKKKKGTKPAALEKSRWVFALSRPVRRALLGGVLILMAFEAAYFHRQYYQEGPKRWAPFDLAYKEVYDYAVAQPIRPIYLVDGPLGPMYMHSFWYATLEGRNIAEFVHQPYRVRPPAGFLVISSENDCTGCDMIGRNGIFMIYRSTGLQPPPPNTLPDQPGVR